MKKHHFAYLAMPVFGLLLTSCSGAPFTEEDFINKIFPNGYWDFVIQLGAFIILILIVFFLGYKPVKRMLQARKDGVNAMLRDAETKQQLANAAAEKKEQTIEEGKAQAAEIIETARKQAEAEKEAILASAKAETDLMRKRAEEDIASARAKSKAEIADEIVDVALLASTQVLGREVSEDDNRRLIQEFLDQLGDGTGDA